MYSISWEQRGSKTSWWEPCTLWLSAARCCFSYLRTGHTMQLCVQHLHAIDVGRVIPRWATSFRHTNTKLRIGTLRESAKRCICMLVGILPKKTHIYSSRISCNNIGGGHTVQLRVACNTAGNVSPCIPACNLSTLVPPPLPHEDTAHNRNHTLTGGYFLPFPSYNRAKSYTSALAVTAHCFEKSRARALLTSQARREMASRKSDSGVTDHFLHIASTVSVLFTVTLL